MPPKTLTPQRPVHYPESDGLPMAENTVQFNAIVAIKENLEIVFADDPQVFVAGDLFWYPREGDNKTVHAPDILVAFGVPKGDRGSYRQWEERGIAPQVVFEVLSPSNRLGEMTRKFQFYDEFGVEEYYVYDPDDGLWDGWQRRDGRLQGIEAMPGWVSPRLGIRFESEFGSGLTLFRPSGERFLSPLEMEQLRREAVADADLERRARDQAQQRADQAQQRADAAERETARQAQLIEQLTAQLRAAGVDLSKN